MHQTTQPTKCSRRSTQDGSHFSLNAASGVSPGAARDTQSSAFLRTAVKELLYSGDAINKP